MSSFHGQTALVTGASSGIGESFAKMLAAQGANLVLVARREDRLLALAETLRREHGVIASVIPQDLGEPGAPQALYDTVTAKGLQVDVLINNAGIGKHGHFVEHSLESQMATLRVNVDALTELTWLFGRDMVNRGRGSVLLVASVAGFMPIPQFASYAASKAFVLSLGKSLHEEWRPHNVNVTVLCPGGTWTEFMDSSGQKIDGLRTLAMMSSDDVAGAGMQGLARKRAVVVPGLMNKMSTAMLRFIPSRVQATLGEIATRGS